MLTRVFNIRKPKKSPNHEEGSSQPQTQTEIDDCIGGLMGDLPLRFCNTGSGGGGVRERSLREVLRSSVEVMGQSGLGISEKIVMLDGVVYAAKRFRKVTVSKGEFWRRIERLANVSMHSNYLVPVRACLYAKRIKLVLCDYFLMGSLADLLAGARKLGHTPLDWDQRLKIIIHLSKAVAFIHSQSPPQEKHLQMNVHGNIKASNVLIKTDFSARLSDYGFTQLAEPTDVLGEWHYRLPETVNFTELSQKNDIHNFGIIVLDMLGGPKAPSQINCILERKEEIKGGVLEFFEFFVEKKKRRQALQVLDIALACTNRSPEARPNIDQILLVLGDVLSTK